MATDAIQIRQNLSTGGRAGAARSSSRRRRSATRSSPSPAATSRPIAYNIAELTGGTVVDGFRAPPPESEMACVVVDCGGTARCGVYPRKRIPTVNLTPVGQAGPLAQFITEDIYVSGRQRRTRSRSPTARAGHSGRGGGSRNGVESAASARLGPPTPKRGREAAATGSST